mgnify:FL=1
MQQWPPNVWHGVIDPNGEPVSPVRMGDKAITSGDLENTITPNTDIEIEEFEGRFGDTYEMVKL